MFRVLFLFHIFFFNYVSAACPPHLSAFSMIFPAKFIFLSEDLNSEEPQTIPGLIAAKILNEFKNESPKILFLGSSKTFSLVKKIASKSSQPSLVNAKLSLYETNPAQFQQDVFESFYDEPNKSIIIRQFQGYTPDNKGPDLKKLPSILATENIKAKIGSTVNQYGAWLTGVGGNVESTSFGLNLIGSGEFSQENASSFVLGLFPKAKDTILFDTSWLALGHIDEVLVEIKSNNDPNGCESTFLINSPKLGLSFEKNKANSKENLELQKKFEYYKKQLVSASKGSCKVNFIEVPMVYKKSSDSYKRTVYASEYPSFTNGLLIKDRYFLVLEDNNKIKKSVAKTLKDIGIKAVWVPVKKGLYSKGIVDGYLHCLTNSIRVCEQ